MTITYEQARVDHEYLWSINAASDMTGAYVDSQDLAKLLKSPTKATARDCYVNQIHHWFDVGPDGTTSGGRIPTDPAHWIANDETVREIAIRHGVIEPVEAV